MRRSIRFVSHHGLLLLLPVCASSLTRLNASPSPRPHWFRSPARLGGRSRYRTLTSVWWTASCTSRSPSRPPLMTVARTSWSLDLAQMVGAALVVSSAVWSRTSSIEYWRVPHTFRRRVSGLSACNQTYFLRELNCKNRVRRVCHSEQVRCRFSRDSLSHKHACVDAEQRLNQTTKPGTSWSGTMRARF